jgi:mannose-1-phosphate guanylyltransferase
MYHALITAGGVGERFWPLSRGERPKQLLKLVDDRSMIRLTVDRLRSMFPVERIWVITSASLGDRLEAELPDLLPGHILREPFGRNTAAAIGVAALHIRRIDPDASMVVQAADHFIQGEEAFLQMLRVAEARARAFGDLVTCGFVPTRVGAGFGHIEVGGVLEERDGLTLYRVARFIEKPPYEEAERYTHSGRHLWNSGIFIWTLADLWTAFRRFMPQLVEKLELHAPTLGTAGEEASMMTLYAHLPSIAVEYGVLERASNLAVIPGAFQWEDIGTWDGLRNVLPVDASGNVIKGAVLIRDVKDSTIICEEGLLGVMGLTGMVVVKSGDTVLVCPRERAEEIRAYLAEYRSNPLMKGRI